MRFMILASVAQHVGCKTCDIPEGTWGYKVVVQADPGDKLTFEQHGFTTRPQAHAALFRVLVENTGEVVATGPVIAEPCTCLRDAEGGLIRMCSACNTLTRDVLRDVKGQG